MSSPPASLPDAQPDDSSRESRPPRRFAVTRARELSTRIPRTRVRLRTLETPGLMKRQIPWTRLIAEGVVIVGSILLAFGVDAWWSEQQARVAARQGLASALEELEASQAELERVALWHERNLNGVEALRAMVEGEPDGSDVAVPDTLLASLLLLNVSDVPTAAVDAFLSSGHIDRVGSATLRSDLLAWTALLKDVRDDEVRFREVFDSRLQVLEEDVDLTSAFDMSIPMFMAGPASRAPIDVTLVDLPVSRWLRNLLSGHSAAYTVMMFQSRLAHTRAIELSELIAAEVD